MNWRFSAALFGVSSLMCLSTSCARPPASEPAQAQATPRGQQFEFAFGATDGTLLDSASTRGRSTVILFVTTFDLASQAEARYLNEVLHEHKPRANAGAVVLEPPKHRVLAEAFRSSLGLDYPVALANPDTLSGEGPFGRIAGVPTVVVLDRDGRLAFRNTGAVSKQQLDAALGAADAGQVLPNR